MDAARPGLIALILACLLYLSAQHVIAGLRTSPADPAGRVAFLPTWGASLVQCLVYLLGLGGFGAFAGLLVYSVIHTFMRAHP